MTDVGQRIFCRVTATNASGSAQAFSNVVGPVAAGGGVWTPADLPGLIAWYKADAGVYSDAGTTLATDGQRVAQWNDQSGDGYHLIAPTPSVDGFFYRTDGFGTGLPAIESTVTTMPGMATLADTVAIGGGNILCSFVVTRPMAGMLANCRLASYVGNGLTLANDYADLGSAILFMAVSAAATADVTAMNNSNTLAASPITQGTKYRIGSVFNGTNHEVYVNNVASGSPVVYAGPLTSPGRLSVGIPGSSWIGFFAELVFTNIVPSTGDRSSLDTYFSTKWGL
jgi:hypothetical protein